MTGGLLALLYRLCMPIDRADPDRGCEYCADDANLYFGHVEQIAGDEANRTLLLRCPRCGSFYEVGRAESAQATRPTTAEITARFSG